MHADHHSVAQQSKTYVRVTSTLQAMVDEFLETGICVIRGTDYNDIEGNWEAKKQRWRETHAPLMSQQLRRSFVRQVAKDLKRPIIFAEVDGWMGHKVIVTIKYLKRNEPVAAPFFLAMENHSITRWSDIKKAPPVQARRDTKNWYVHFNGEKGRKIFDEWLEQCRTDPVFRKALKLI